MSKEWKMYLLEHKSLSEIAKELSVTKAHLKRLGLK